MKRLLVIICLFPLLSCAQQQQKKSDIVIKDINDKVISYDEMSYLLLTGDYKMQQLKNEQGEFSEIKLLKTTPQEKDAALQTLSTPNPFFKHGENVPNEKFTTIDGQELSFEQLKGKVIVVNVWFTTCAPCLKEMPELNELVEEYKSNEKVVFLAFSTDNKQTVERFLTRRSFNYKHIAGVGDMLEKLELGTFPTNLVITPEGKTMFIAGGYFPTIKQILKYMIDKSLDINDL
ncbi:TlpA family protein disulfide reductase [Solitalea canadensis]|nr:TlpA disulfide reductase family protein [Solitalea canadensis]